MEKKQGIRKYLDALIDDEGFKTEVTITVTDQTLQKLSAYLIGTVIISAIMVCIIQRIANRIGVAKANGLTSNNFNQ